MGGSPFAVNPINRLIEYTWAIAWHCYATLDLLRSWPANGPKPFLKIWTVSQIFGFWFEVWLQALGELIEKLRVTGLPLAGIPLALPFAIYFQQISQEIFRAVTAISRKESKDEKCFEIVYYPVPG
jgi:hypothetical protein